MHSFKWDFVLVLVSLVGAFAKHKAQNPHNESIFLNEKTNKFAVIGNQLPEVDFDIGESYAGTLPIDRPPLSRHRPAENDLFFWFFPSKNPAAKKEIVIWFNGGSGMQGVLQEHGPFLWQSGTQKPVANPYSWNKLTHVIYIDQPVGTGFSQGKIKVKNEVDVANDFMGFWQNFVKTFSIPGYKIYLTGEGYAGQYVPYIAKEMLDEGDKGYFDVAGIQIIDPMMHYEQLMQEVPAADALEKYNNVMGLDYRKMAHFEDKAKTCGYTDYLEKHTTTFPPSGPIPLLPSFSDPHCKIWQDIVHFAKKANPCFNIYHLTDFCPYLWSQLDPSSFGGGLDDYFNRPDVQKAIHAPKTDFLAFGRPQNIFPAGDQSLPSSLGALPSVIDRTNNVIIAHGLLDFSFFAGGSLIAIQNMTWGGLQGFREGPSPTDNFFVPANELNTAGSGLQGVTHSERGLTFVTVNLAGRSIPQYTPGAAYRQLEFLLGRISSLEKGPFTTEES